MHIPAEERYITRQQAAKILSVSPPTFHSLLLKGKLQQYKIGGKKLIRYKLSELGSALE